MSFLEAEEIFEEDKVMMSGSGLCHASLTRVMMLGICCDIPEV